MQTNWSIWNYHPGNYAEISTIHKTIINSSYWAFQVGFDINEIIIISFESSSWPSRSIFFRSIVTHVQLLRVNGDSTIWETFPLHLIRSFPSDDIQPSKSMKAWARKRQVGPKRKEKNTEKQKKRRKPYHFKTNKKPREWNWMRDIWVFCSKKKISLECIKHTASHSIWVSFL